MTGTSEADLLAYRKEHVHTARAFAEKRSGWCCAVSPEYRLCTRPAGHPLDRHIAESAPGVVVETWTGEDDV